MPIETSFDFKNYILARRKLVEERLAQYLSYNDPEILWESIRYSVLSGGKRLRALLCLATAEAISSNTTEIALPCACAIEIVHAMSLIHDDLPALDNDDLRRGRPTNHTVYGEAIALLAGDALLAMATEILIENTKDLVDDKTLLSIALNLAKAIGADGMVGGQVIDISLTGQASGQKTDINLIESMHRRKTGALIRFSTWAGAKLAGANQNQLKAFAQFGEILGLAFQITDDLLDVTGDALTLGKTPGKDVATQKPTWVQHFGLEKSKQQLVELKSQGKTVLSETGITKPSLVPLENLLEYSINRIN